MENQKGWYAVAKVQDYLSDKFGGSRQTAAADCIKFVFQILNLGQFHQYFFVQILIFLIQCPDDVLGFKNLVY